MTPKIHKLKGHFSYIYFAEYEDKILLLDGGCRADVSLIEKFITENINRKIDDIKLIIITHIHPDHAGAGPILAKKYNIPLAAHPLIKKWYTGIGGFFQHLTDIMFAQSVILITRQPFKRLWYKKFFHIDYFIEDNSVIPFFTDWKSIFVPGHTSHDIIIYNEQNKILYAADLILNINRKFILPFPVTIPELMKKSMEKISSLKVKNILLAHGGDFTIENFSDLMQNLSESINAKVNFKLRMVKPLTKMSPEIKKSKSKK